MDQLHAEFPRHDVIMFEISKKEISKFKGVMPKPECPRGHTGLRDGRPVVVRTDRGFVQCSVCGYLGS